MSTGRRPKPTALKVLQGNPGKRKLSKTEPQPRTTTRPPPPPSILSPRAATEWRRIATELHRLGLLTILDRAALAAYCAAYGRWADAEVKIAELGAVLTTKKTKTMCHNPWRTIADKAMEQMLKIGIEFGLTPSSRVRLGTGTPRSDDTPAPSDPFEDFLNARKR